MLDCIVDAPTCRFRCLAASGLSLPVADGFDEIPLGEVFCLFKTADSERASEQDGEEINGT